MGDNTNKSRRWFLSLGLFSSDKKAAEETVKMLTADGKLVEVKKSIVDAASKEKAGNKEILGWMNNPSKNDDQ